MTDPKIILYDVPSKEGRCNSLNVWKVRLLLNRKGIPYTTRWLEYPDIAPTLKSLGISPYPDGTSYVPYTLPAVTIQIADEDPIHMMDSLAIATTLDRLFPSPPLYTSDPSTARTDGLLNQLIYAFFPAFMPQIPSILNPVSAEYYERERARLVGTTLAEFGRMKGQEAWEDAKLAMEAWKEELARDKRGPFVLGDKLSYSDFNLVSMFAGLERIDRRVFERLLSYDESFGKLYGTCKEWMTRDSW